MHVCVCEVAGEQGNALLVVCGECVPACVRLKLRPRVRFKDAEFAACAVGVRETTDVPVLAKRTKIRAIVEGRKLEIGRRIVQNGVIAQVPSLCWVVHAEEIA